MRFATFWDKGAFSVLKGPSAAGPDAPAQYSCKPRAIPAISQGSDYAGLIELDAHLSVSPGVSPFRYCTELEGNCSPHFTQQLHAVPGRS
jgi:hypothetical protein